MANKKRLTMEELQKYLDYLEQLPRHAGRVPDRRGIQSGGLLAAATAEKKSA